MTPRTPPKLFERRSSDATQAYRNLRDPPSEKAANCRTWVDSLWNQFHPYADEHFIQEFSLHTHQRFWEMYVAVTLLDAGHAIDAPKPGPDFSLTLAGRKIWVEAVAPTPGEPGKPDSVPQLEPQQGEITSGYFPQDRIVLRCASAIAEKLKAQQEYMGCGIISPDDCYIIAVNYADTYPRCDVGTPPCMLRAVLGLGSHFVTIDRNTGKIIDRGVQYRGNLLKATGALVDTGLFLSLGSAPLSAVIGSVATIAPVYGCRYQMGQDFMLIHNPLARNAPPTGLLNRGEEVQVLLREDEFEVSCQQLEG